VTQTRLDAASLGRAIAGDVVVPGSPTYEQLRKPAIARFDDVRPEAIVLCRNPSDVAEALAVARHSGLPARPRSGGHCFAGRSSTEGVVIDVTPMSSVSVSDGLATVGAGARLGDVYDALLPHDVTIPAGCGPEVGIAGLTLGGGLGILGRSHGLTSDQLVRAQVVLADGRILECDEARHEDLFWALRGAGGGTVGVVTSLTFRTVQAPRATSFHLVWPHVHATTVIGAWQDWAPGGPEELAASVLVTAPADPDRPPAVHVFGAMLDGEAAASELLDDMVARVGIAPSAARRAEHTYRQTKRHLAEHGPAAEEAAHGEPAEEGHPYSKSEYFRRPLSEEAIGALVEHLTRGRTPGESRELDFTPWGGAYNRVPPDATAFVHREELFLLKQAVVVPPDASSADREAARGWLRRSWELVHPWGSGGVYPNFPDPELDHEDAAYYGSSRDRVARVKRTYDPEGYFG
jgi:FAD/FMN-containing dehydrogenase